VSGGGGVRAIHATAVDDDGGDCVANVEAGAPGQ
jgi:hypothetical protein